MRPTPPPVDQVRRPVSVTDAIEMTRFGDPSYISGGSAEGLVAKFSPDGKHFVTIVRKGNLEQNTNEYSLLLFETDEVSRSPVPRVLASLASSSNRPAIKNVAWLEDNDTILFLGERPADQAQLYSVKRTTGALQRLTNHSTSLTAFANSRKGDLIVYAAELPASSFLTEASRRTGIRVTHELLSDLLKGSWGESDPRYQLFIQRPGVGTAVPVRLIGEIGDPQTQILLSPDGKYCLIRAWVKQIPELWGKYENKVLRLFTEHHPPPGARIGVEQYELVDTQTGASQVLLDAPLDPDLGAEAAWAPDSMSVVLSDVYLPLDVAEAAEEAERKSHRFLVEVTVPEREILKISDRGMKLIEWNQWQNYIICELTAADGPNAQKTSRVYLHKSGSTWLEVAGPGNPRSTLPVIVLEEDLNTPPRIVAINPATHQRSMVMDLNPHFREVAFAKVEQVQWKDPQGNDVKGGLYWPADYMAGKKYPLIIQTHGFRPERFWIDGPFTTAFAAQPLASRGFFVLQVSHPDAGVYLTPDEAPRAAMAYEGAIEYLYRLGLIDKNRIGIIGFSRTCLYVTYALTHSKYRFAAASIADGIDAGYFLYIGFAPSIPPVANIIEALNGGPPFGEGLSLWLKRSPEFMMSEVQSPLMIQALGPLSLLEEWSWFSGLSRLQKPVEMIYIPDGAHILQKPWERMISQQGNVDWFDFWLKGHEDTDPAKAEQYARWRELRKLQEESEKKAPGARTQPAPQTN